MNDDTGGALSHSVDSAAGTGHDITFTGCDFTDNHVVEVDGQGSRAEGGALDFVRTGKLTITNCDFVENTATLYGGAIRMVGVIEATVTGCLFDGNIADEMWGGAVYLANSGDGDSDKSIEFVNCTFQDNEAEEGAKCRRQPTRLLPPCAMRSARTIRPLVDTPSSSFPAFPIAFSLIWGCWPVTPAATQ